MKTIKTVIITLISCYIFLISFLFITKTVQNYKMMNKKVTFTNDEVYEKTVKDSKEKINKYKKLAKTEEDKKCLNSIEKYVDFTYSLNHPNGKTYKEYYEEWRLTPPLEYVSTILKSCSVNKESDNYKNFMKYSVGNILHYEEDFKIDFAFNMLPSVNLYESMFFIFSKSTIQESKQQIRQTPEFINNDNLINAYDSILKEVGEKYEK